MALPSVLTRFLTKKNKGSVRLCTLRKSRAAEAFGFAVYCKRRQPAEKRYFVVCSLCADSPAERSGLRCRDRILEVDGVNVFDEPYLATVQRLKAAQKLTSLKLLVAEPEAYKEYAALGLPMNAQLPGTVVVAEPPGDGSSCERSSKRHGHKSPEDDARFTPHTLDGKNVTFAPSDKKSPVARCVNKQRRVTLSPVADQQGRVILSPPDKKHGGAMLSPAAEQHGEATLSRAAKHLQHGKVTVSPVTEQHHGPTLSPAATQLGGATLSPAAEQHGGATVSPVAEQRGKATVSPVAEQRGKATVSPVAEQRGGATVSPAADEQESDTTSSLSFHTAEEGSDSSWTFPFPVAEQEFNATSPPSLCNTERQTVSASLPTVSQVDRCSLGKQSNNNLLIR